MASWRTAFHGAATLFLLCQCMLNAHVLRQDNTLYRSLSTLAASQDFHMESVDEGWILLNQDTRIFLPGGKGYFSLDGLIVHLGSPLVVKKGRPYLSELDWHFTLLPLVHTDHKKLPPPPVRVIVIDPGHGGTDPGAVNTNIGLEEKELTLITAKKLENLLQNMGFKVLLTRTDDTFSTLWERSEFAREHGADLFISLHFNGSDNANANGVETFAFPLVSQPSTGRSHLIALDHEPQAANQFDKENIRLAYSIQSELIRATDATDRGVKRARFTVLRDLECPGVLVELGFLTHPDTAIVLKQPESLSVLAEAVAAGIKTYNKGKKPQNSP